MNAPNSPKHLYGLPFQTKALEMNTAVTGDVSYANVLGRCMQGDGSEIRVVDSEAINVMAQLNSGNRVVNSWRATDILDLNLVPLGIGTNKSQRKAANTDKTVAA